METKAPSEAITARQPSGATPDQMRDARARAWRFVINAHEKKKAAETGPKPK